jgi:membrane peptidoglycan carboxypeptidase
MGNDWQDYRPRDRRLDRDAHQPQNPQSSQQWDNASRQDWRPQGAGDPSFRGSENRQPPQPPRPRQTGNLAPHNGSGLLSRARNGGPGGPLRPGTSGPLGPQAERSTRNLGGSFGPPGRSEASQSGYTQRPSSRRTSSGQDDLLNAPTQAGISGPRQPGGPAERRHNGGGLLSFARAASSRMRAIITGQHRAARPSQAAEPFAGAPPASPPETEEERPRPPRYRRSRTRLVIHKRLERRSHQSKRLLIASIATGFMVAVLLSLSIYGTSSVSAFYQDTQSKLSSIGSPSAFPQTTRFFDRNGTLLYEMHDNAYNYRTYVPLALVPQSLINATVDTEDKTFWTNSGVDVNSIIRAALGNLVHQEITSGASTITQQVIKNAFFVDPTTGVADETYTRKIQEAMLAYSATGQYSKQQILEFYLNIILYGYHSRGIEAAAENIFGLKPKQDPKTHQLEMGVQQLDPAQAAFLAGLPQGPSLYNPCPTSGNDTDVTARRQAALQRMDQVVLPSMLSVGDITQQQLNEIDAEANKPDFFNCQPLGVEQAPHFVDYVIGQLEAMLDPADPTGVGAELLARAGWNVYTTVDLRLENYVEQDVKKQLFQTHTDNFTYDNGTIPPLSKAYNINDAAVVVLDPRNGDILAMDGSGDYYKYSNKREGGENNAAISYIQPGSSFKPIVYAAAFDMGWSPALVLQNERVCFPIPVDPNTQAPKSRQACGGWYSPINYNDSFATTSSGVPKPGVRIRDALGSSLNIPAVQTLYFAGLDNVMNMAERLGVNSPTFQPGCDCPSIALGSASVRLLDMAGAYGVFADGGYRVPPRSILMITDQQGNVVPGGDFTAVHPVQVLSPQTAFLVTSILQDNAARQGEFGYNNALTFHDQPYVAAKTGTTESFKDNLTMGYTPYLSVGVWAGNADGEVMTGNVIGITGAAPIWHDVIAYATKLYHYPDSYWQTPGGVGLYRINGATGLAPYQGTNGNYADWFNVADIPSVS